MDRILPVFRAANFLFPDNNVPEHIEEDPTVPSYIGVYGLFTYVRDHSPYTFAVDIETESLARELAMALWERQEMEIPLYGYSTDVWIKCPDGEEIRYYSGRVEFDDDGED
jgi:hypothetical protein